MVGPSTLKKRDVILSAVKSDIRKTTYKYGIEIPTSVEYTIQIDQKNTYWQYNIKLEMYNAGIAFEFWMRIKEHHQDGN